MLFLEPGMLKRKRQKFESNPKIQLQELEANRGHPSYMLNIPMDPIKMEPRDTTPSPYDAQIQGGLSPMYTPNIAVSPQGQYRIAVDPLGPTPPPADLQPRNVMYSSTGMNITALPSISDMLPQSWDMAGASAVAAHNDLGGMNIDGPGNISNLLDLDSQELKQFNLNSGELPTSNMFDPNILSETLCNNLSFSDISLPRPENQNMTDSLTRLANNTIDSIYQLNSMYKPEDKNNPGAF